VRIATYIARDGAAFACGQSVRYSEGIGDGDEMAQAPLIHGFYFSEIPALPRILQTQDDELAYRAKTVITENLPKFAARIVTNCRVFAEV
jgi:hypothetical protein